MYDPIDSLNSSLFYHVIVIKFAVCIANHCGRKTSFRTKPSARMVDDGLL
jgi:hypothetical protein